MVHSMNYYEKDNNSSGLAEQATRLQALVADIISCCQDRQLMESSRFGLPQAELKCLLALDGSRYRTPKELAASLDVTKSRITKLLDGLADKDMIRKTPDPGDGRIKLIHLTASGQARLRDVKSHANLLHQRVLGQLEPVQVNSVLASLEMLWGAMETVKQQDMLNNS
jgi:DNA-binding MarR family transcriptional regulator